MAALAALVDGSGSGIEPTAPMAALFMVAEVDGGGNDGIFTTASHDNDRPPCPHCPRPLLDEDWGGGCTMTRLILCRHGCCCWHHLCLHLRYDSTKDDGCCNRQGWHANICGREEVGHHNPIGVEQQKQKQKQNKNKNKNKNKINNSGGNVATSAPADSYARGAAAAASALAEAAAAAAWG